MLSTVLDNEQYVFVFDAVGKSSFAKCKPLLKEKGIYSWSDGLENIPLALITPLFGGKKVVFFPPNNITGELNFMPLKQHLQNTGINTRKGKSEVFNGRHFSFNVWLRRRM